MLGAHVAVDKLQPSAGEDKTDHTYQGHDGEVRRL